MDFTYVWFSIIIASNLWIIVVAFKESFGWGLVCMLFGWIGPLLFAIEHWKKVRWPLICLYFGTILLFIDVYHDVK